MHGTRQAYCSSIDTMDPIVSLGMIRCGDYNANGIVIWDVVLVLKPFVRRPQTTSDAVMSQRIQMNGQRPSQCEV